MKPKGKLNFFHLALIIGLIFNGSLVFYTLENTYDALIHSFFGNHYAVSWWEPWEPRWYTGFTVMSYPPLVHQLIGLFSIVFNLKIALFLVVFIEISLFILGVYNFAYLITSNRDIAGISALICSFLTVFIETLHIFGQLPTLMGISLLLLSLPPIYKFIRFGKKIYFFKALSLLSATVCSHHVTPIFGMVFFIFPIIGMAWLDESLFAYSLNYNTSTENIKLPFKQYFYTLKRILPRIIVFGFSTLLALIIFILPYWLISKSDPISQVPIPHGSRDNFFEVTSSGFIFFLVPWGISLMLFPYLLNRFFSRRYLFLGLSFLLLSLLGTGGTTPIPRKLLGENAFNILTLDRFTFWANILCIPFVGEFFYRLFWGDYAVNFKRKFGVIFTKGIYGFTIILFMAWAMFIVSLGYFRPFQPQKIKIQPILNFMSQDQHYQWRYLTLGFGDQMAWLSAHMNAETIDGNYHSARRLPELTTRSVERLEGAKFRGIEGLGSLQEILSNAEKYNLKFIFSNDKFYDPLLFFYGWEKLTLLENGIWIWQKLDVPPLQKYRYHKEFPLYQKIMWAVMPVLAIVLVFIFNVMHYWLFQSSNGKNKEDEVLALLEAKLKYKNVMLYTIFVWSLFAMSLWVGYFYTEYYKKLPEKSAYNTLIAYYDALDMKQFEKAYTFVQNTKSFDQFMLEISISDGIINSYGKMNDINIQILNENKNQTKAKVNIEWITPLKTINTNEIIDLKKINDKWKIVPKRIDPSFQQYTFVAKPTVEYYSHGKRLIDVERVNFDDNLQQPVLEISNVNMIEKNGKYHILGELQNIDIFPTCVNIKVELYDIHSNKIAISYAKDLIKHFINPKEVTPFRIDIDALDMLEDPIKKNKKDTTPDKRIPTKLVLHATSVVSYKKIQNDIIFSDFFIDSKELKGTLYNSGIDEVTIPQLLVSFFDDQSRLIWVQEFYGENAIKSQKSASFEFKYDIAKLERINFLRNSDSTSYLNGIKNSPLIHLQNNSPIIFNNEHKARAYKIILNNFVGNIK
jgi:hypothetical protein